MIATALTVVHKFIRHELFDTSRMIACAGPDDAAAIIEKLDSVVALLETHAEHEEIQFEPLLRNAAPDDADRLTRDHRALHAELDNVHAAARSLDTQHGDARVAALLQLHLDWNRFVGHYLLHIDDEERSMFNAIRESIPAIELIAQGARANDPEGAGKFLEMLCAIVAPVEREAINRG